MKQSTLGIAAGIGIAGLLAGAGMKKLTGSSSAPEPSAPVVQEASVRPRLPASAPVAEKRSITSIPAGQHSQDTLDSLPEASSPDHYRRLALWLVDANVEDVAACWDRFDPKGSELTDAQELIFMTWMRLDPAGGMAKLAGSRMEYLAWFSWGASDPEGAFAAAQAKNQDSLGWVLWGLGQFNPDWIRDHLEQIPEDLRQRAVAAIGRWRDGRDPGKALDFSLKHMSYQFDEKTFRLLVSQDPAAALEWAIKHPSGRGEPQWGGQTEAIDAFVSQLSESDPEMLRRLASTAPPGETRRKMEAALFQQLLNSDPKAAEAQALALKSPRVASERLAAVGLSAVKDDPEHAFSMMQKILEIYPDAISGHIYTFIEGSGSTGSKPPPGVADLITGLLGSDPGRLLEMQKSTMDVMSGQSNFQAVASKWMEADPAGLTAWAANQQDPQKTSQITSVAINYYTSHEQYPDAMQWASGIQEANNRQNSVRNILGNWASRQPQEASQWLDSSDMSDAERARIRAQIPYLKQK